MHKDFALLRKYASGEESFAIVSRHGLEVLGKAIEVIGRKRLYERVDLDLVVSGCILHDIGALDFFDRRDMDGYIRHGILGAEILTREGREKEALIAKRHTGAGLTKEEIAQAGWLLPQEDLLPVSLEERIVCYADKFSSKRPDAHETIETIMKEFEGYGPGPLARFRALREEFE